VIEGEKLAGEAEGLSMIDTLLLSESYEGKYSDFEHEKTIIIKDDLFSYISEMKTTQGILAIVKKDQTIPGDTIFEVLAQDLQDPGNLGTLLRTSESFGVELLTVTEKCADPYSTKAIRASMGSILRMPVLLTSDPVSYILRKKEQGFIIITGHLQGKDIAGMDFGGKKRVLFVSGNESRGVGDDISGISDILCRIPMYGQNESLNASVAAGIILYEIKKRL
jgi:TrmH family RNA methyltransferase